ncbi:MAG: PIN domain-containing protein [Terriglobales bacterium]
MNGDKGFLDTSILLYALCPSVPAKAQTAKRLLERALVSGDAVVSYQVVQEFVSVAQQKFRSALSPSELDELLGRVFLPLLAVESSLELVRAGLALQRQRKLAWHDALIVAAALQAGCRVLYSEDFQHGQSFDDLRVVNPFL